MYLNFFEMKNMPFTRAVPPEKLYESQATVDILGRLAYVADRELFAVLIADAGCGKSTLIRKFASSLPKDEYVLLYLSDSKLTPRWFYKGLLDQLGIISKYYRGDAKRQLHYEIEKIHCIQNKKVVCVLDEAHLLDKETLEEFRFLLNFKFDSISPMALILVGQSELWDNKLHLNKFAAIRQRIDMMCVLPHMDRSEVEYYIKAHMEYAECPNELFTSRAMDEIHKASGGIARVVNRICDKSLMYAYQQHLRLIDDHTVRFVIDNELSDFCN